MPGHHVRERGSQRSGVQGATKAEGERHVVCGRGLGVEPVEEPEPVLCGRERDALGPRPGDERGGGVGGRLRRGEEGGEIRRGGVVEDGAQRQLDARCPAQPGDEARREQRVTAAGEEVGVGGNLGHIQHVGEGRAHCPLTVRGRCAPLDIVAHGHGQRPPVHLARRGQRQGVQDDDDGRHHVRRQDLSEAGAQRRGQGPDDAGAGGVVGERGCGSMGRTLRHVVGQRPGVGLGARPYEQLEQVLPVRRPGAHRPYPCLRRPRLDLVRVDAPGRDRSSASRSSATGRPSASRRAAETSPVRRALGMPVTRTGARDASSSRRSTSAPQARTGSTAAARSVTGALCRTTS